MDDRLKVVNHVVCLLSEALEVVETIRNAPESPVTSYLPAGLRRVFRRNAGRLRSGKLRSRYRNRYSTEDLAIIFERTAQRDDTIEHGLDKLTRILEEVHRVFEYQRAELEEGTRIVYALAQQRAEEDGPESKAAAFFRLFQEMIAKGAEIHTLNRRKKELAPVEPFTPPGADPDREERDRICVAEIVPVVSGSDEPVLRFACETNVSEEPPLVMRIGLGDRSWVGSFTRGTTDYTTVQLMPDGAHLLVVACGAGYVVEAVTRSLARQAGTDIMDVLEDDEAGLLILDRANTYFEAFGRSGPLWKTGRIGAGAFRNVEFGDGAISGETQQGSDGDWVEFSVDLGTGEVSWAILMETT
ncbi:MAG TPA: hypothetical protein VF381_09735 [Thermoanaerobaculia bacterium]